MICRIQSKGLNRGRALLASLALLLLSAQTTALARVAPPPSTEGRAGTLSTPAARPDVPGRLAEGARAELVVSCDPLPLSSLPERPVLPWVRAARSLDTRPASARPADAVHHPAPARGPPRSHLD